MWGKTQKRELLHPGSNAKSCEIIHTLLRVETKSQCLCRLKKEKRDLLRSLVSLAHEAGDVEYVMESGGEREKNDDEISCRKIKSVAGHGGEQDHSDRDDLDERAEFSEPRRFESAEPGHDIYRAGDGDDQNIASDDCGRDPEGNR